MKIFIGGFIAISLILPICHAAYGQQTKRRPMSSERVAASERFMAEKPQAFIFSCNFTGTKTPALKKTEIKISSLFYLSEIIPSTSIDISDEDLTQQSADSLCYDTWAARIKNDTLDYFKAVRRDLTDQVAARSHLLQQISSAEKQALYAEEEKRIERIKEQIRNLDRVIARLEAA